MSTYKAWIQSEIGPFTDLKIETMEMPTIGENEVLIETKAATLNFADLLLASGMYQSNPDTPFVPGFEVAGVVKQCSDNSGLKVGDRVVGATTVFRSGRYGSFGEYCISSEKLTYKIPDEINFEAAAGILMAYLTSDFALYRRAGIQEGQRVLVNAAAGGVGLAAVQLAKIANAEVIAAVGSDEKVEFLKKYQPDLIINYRKENLKEKIEKQYGKRPIDIFYDQVGGEPYEEGVRLLKSEGKALIVGFASGNIPSQILSYLLVKNISIMGVFMISFEDDDSKYLHSRMENLFNLYLEKKIDPVYETIPFEKIIDYLDLIGSRKTIGRIVATI
ncbi:MAG: NADPH:quinone oxidoreductase family protein [Actinomycetota bacterium]|nr:NADPH:quinone oxidoreductase family protein [Actinomycetota bacterium]